MNRRLPQEHKTHSERELERIARYYRDPVYARDRAYRNSQQLEVPALREALRKVKSKNVKEGYE